MIPMKRRTKHTQASRQASEQKKNISNGKEERKCFYITLAYVHFTVHTQQTSTEENQKATIFPRLLLDAYFYIYLNGSEPKAFIHTQKFDREFLIEGDTSAQFYCCNLFLPINKLHKLLRETCY